MIIIKLSKPARMTNKRADMVRAAQFFIKSLRISKYDAIVLIEFRYFHTFLTGNLAQVEQNGNMYKLVIDANINDLIALSTMAHEMVHIKQYIKGQLSENKKGYQLWKGKKVNADTKYHALPWEVEAMQKEIIMAHQYINYRDSL